MKRLFKLFKVILLTASLFLSVLKESAQAPQKMSYQAVIRDAGNKLVPNHSVGMRITILQGSANGTPVYVETQTPASNVNGLVTIEIGTGKTVDKFSSINWANGPYFIKTDSDPMGGTNYTITGTNELVSVPFALYSASGILAPGSAAGNTPFWNGFAWVANNSNIYNNGGNVGIGTSVPSARLDIAGGNNWELLKGEGDFRIGNSEHRLKVGVALEGGGAGAVGIMQQGHQSGYNVLSLGAQGKYLLYLNGSTQKVGIGIDNPVATLDIRGTISITDGTQGSGKVLTSDASGKASWVTQGSGNGHYIGELYQGGIIVSVWKTNGEEHGLIASLTDIAKESTWSNIVATLVSTTQLSPFDGRACTTAIVNQPGHSKSAASLCDEYSSGDFSDWYLPAIWELNQCYNAAFVVAKILGSVNGFQFDSYWSSTEFNSNDALFMNFIFGNTNYNNKGYKHYVRAVRTF